MFRFTIRDVLWLTVVVAVLVAWGLDRWQLVAQIPTPPSDLHTSTDIRTSPRGPA